MRSLSFRINPWLAFAGVVCFASTGVRADSLHVTAADALSNKAYDLKFAAPPGATVLGITPLPANPRSSVRSIVYVANEQTAKADLIAADNRTSRIVRYAGASGTAITVWSGTGAGPTTPIGLSVDSFGNLFVGRGDQGHPELWVVKPNPVQPPTGGAFLAPVLIDKTSFGSSGQTRMMDSLVVRTSVAGGLGTGDLLVLLSDGRVLRYSATSIASFLAGHGLTGTPTTLIAASYFTQGHVPTSMAIWPTDGSLLVTTVDGAVRRYSLTPTGSTPMPNFATGLGSEATGVGQLLGLIRTFVSSSGPYAVLDNPQRNKIFELGAPPPLGCPNLAVPCNTPVTVTTVSNPVGLAVTDASAASLDCVNTGGNPSGCALLTGTVKVGVSSATTDGSVIVVSCSVDDPRFDTTLGYCNSNPLKASDVCPGYPDTYVPTYLCGASGASHHAMTFLKFEEAHGFAHAPPDLLVDVELSAEAILGTGGGVPPCPQLTTGWAPLGDEGSIPEGNVMMEPTSHCGSTRQLTPGHSLMLVGAQMNFGTDQFTLANDKFDALSGTISATTNMNSTPQAALATCVDNGKTLLNASSLTTATRYACAAHQAWTCDQSVLANQFFGDNPHKLSNLSAIKGRLENLIMHIDNRLLSSSDPPPWPQPDPMPAGTVATCDITAPPVPTNLHSDYVASPDGKTLHLTWTASTDSGEVNFANPGLYASGTARYHVYLNGTEYLPGSPPSSAALDITLSTSSSADLFSVTITAEDSATPTANVSVLSTPLTVHCYDPDLSGNCEPFPTPPPP